MREQNDWLFRMIHNFVGQVRLIVENQRDVVFAWDVFGRNDREFVPGQVAFERNVLDASTWNRAAHSHAVQHPVELQIINVERRTGDFLAAFFAGDCFTNESHWVRWNSSSLERSGDAISHIVVGTATHRIVLNLKGLEDITSQNRLLIMDLTVHQRGNDKPISSYNFIRYVVPLTYQFRISAAQGLIRDVVAAINAHLNAAGFLAKHLAIAVFGLALGYQKIGWIADRIFESGVSVSLIVVLRSSENGLTSGDRQSHAQTYEADEIFHFKSQPARATRQIHRASASSQLRA